MTEGIILAEAVRFELTDSCPSTVFKTVALNHSATLPNAECGGSIAYLRCSAGGNLTGTQHTVKLSVLAPRQALL